MANDLITKLAQATSWTESNDVVADIKAVAEETSFTTYTKVELGGGWHDVWATGMKPAPWLYTVPRWAPLTAADDVRTTELASRIDALGKTPKAIATSLRKQGIVATPGSPTGCAIAVWLRKNFESYGSVSVGPYGVTVVASDVQIVVPTSPVVRTFMRLFDTGYFRELVYEPTQYDGVWPTPAFGTGIEEASDGHVPGTFSKYLLDL